MSDWNRVAEELEKWDDPSLPARLWLRDDDAVEPTSSLERLTELTGQFDVPVTIAVIPKLATEALAHYVAGATHVRVALHGYSHTNHARHDQKKCELGLQREKQVVLDELMTGRITLERLFGERFINMLVPPWNRIDPLLVRELATVGLASLSTFGWNHFSETRQVSQINTHVDIIDWRGTRGGRPVKDLVHELAGALTRARQLGGAPVGILSHHLVHDEMAWEFLQQLFSFINQHGQHRQQRQIKWCHAASLSETSTG